MTFTIIVLIAEKEPKLMTTKLHEDTNKGVLIKELTEKERMHTEEKEKLESECRALKSNNMTYLLCHIVI